MSADASIPAIGIRTNVEVQRIRGGTLCDDAKTYPNLLARLRLALGKMRIVAHIVGELVVDEELVRISEGRCTKSVFVSHAVRT